MSGFTPFLLLFHHLDFHWVLLLGEECFEILCVHPLHVSIQSQHDEPALQEKWVIVFFSVSQNFIRGTIEVYPSGSIPQISKSNVALQIFSDTVKIGLRRHRAVFISVVKNFLTELFHCPRCLWAVDPVFQVDHCQDSHGRDGYYDHKIYEDVFLLSVHLVKNLSFFILFCPFYITRFSSSF